VILGIGTDLVEIARIERVLARHGTRFVRRCFTAGERRAAESGAAARVPAAHFAKRFAAKEACAKALGSGIGSVAAGGPAVSWQDIEVVRRHGGAPALALSGGAAARLAARIPATAASVRAAPVAELRLAGEDGLALASVVLTVR